jgi:hypothetical protein
MRALGWEALPGEDSRTGTLRSLVIGMMGRAGDPDVARAAFGRLLACAAPGGAREGSALPLPLPGDWREAAFRCAIRHDEGRAFRALREVYEGSALPEEQRGALAAMGCVEAPALQAEVLGYAFFSGRVRPQDVLFPLGSLSASSDGGGRACWRFLVDNYDRIHSLLGSGPMWPGCVGLCCRGLRSSEEAGAAEAFFRERDPGSARRRLAQALDLVRVQVRRRERDREGVQRFLDRRFAD